VGPLSWKHRSSVAQIATTSGLVLVRFTEPPPLSVFGAYRGALDEVIRATPANRAALVHLAEVGPASRDRATLAFELTRLMRDYDGKIVAAAMVVLARGFLNAMVRSMAAGAIRSVRPKTKVALVDELGEAAAFVTKARGEIGSSDVDELVTRFATEARAQ
jgi:hypothetical protein